MRYYKAQSQKPKQKVFQQFIMLLFEAGIGEDRFLTKI